jgi:large subunit ribosomal protein L4
MKLKVVRTTSRDSHVTVSDQLFDQPNDQLLAQAIRVYLANQRQGTSKTQTRSEVSRTTRKWYRQKGTGNARHGAKDAVLFVGGAVAHGPTGQENWKLKLTQKLKHQALVAALSAQIDNIVLNDEITELEGKTKQAFQLLKKIAAKFEDENLDFDKNKFLIVVAQKKPKVQRSLNNLQNIMLVNAKQLNALAVAQADKIVITQAALEELETRLLSQKNEN